MADAGARSRQRNLTPAVLACVTALALLVVACGSKYTYEELAASQGTVPSGETPSVGIGDTDTATTLGTTDPGIPVAGGASGDAGAAGSPAAPTSGSSDSDAPATASCTGSKSPIKIGAVGTQSGLIGSIQKSQVIAVQAWAARMNASGGLGCHPIKYIVADDGGDPSKHLALVRRLVEQDGVVAFVQMDAVLTGQASVDYLNERGVPVIGSSGGDNWFYTSPVHFTPNATGDPYIVASLAIAGELAKQQGGNEIGSFACIEASICSRVNEVAARLDPKYGIRTIYRGSGSITQPDFTSSCLDAQKAGVKVLAIALDASSLQRFARSCATVGFRPTVVALGISLSATLPSDPNVDGWYGAVSTTPFNSGNPLAVEHREALQRYASSQGPTPGSMQGYLAAKLFELAMQNPPETVTAAEVLKRLRAVKGTDLSGATSPLDFTGPKIKSFCGWLVRVEDKGYESVSDEPVICGSL